MTLPKTLPNAEPKPPESTLRVLVIEDSAPVAESLQIALESHGFACRLALSGTDGLREAEAFPADVILIDIGLPDLDGASVARALRSREVLPTPLLVALSGRPQDECCPDNLFDHYFTKPVRLTSLLELLRTTRLQ